MMERGRRKQMKIFRILGVLIVFLVDPALAGLPVLDDQKRLIGFLSEQDCIPSLLTGSYHCDSRTRVEDLMSRTPLFVSPDDSILDLARQMTGARPKVYPVLEGGKVVGIINRRQVMQALNAQMKQCQAT